jgi:hypothetical protein
VMRERRILAFDEAAVLAEAGEIIDELRARTEAGRVVLDQALPGLSARFREIGRI